MDACNAQCVRLEFVYFLHVERAAKGPETGDLALVKAYKEGLVVV